MSNRPLDKSDIPALLEHLNGPSLHDLPAGYYPQLPTCVAPDDLNVSGCFGTGIEGTLLTVFRVVSRDPWEVEYLVKDMPCNTEEARKAHCIAHDYLTPWSYCGESLPARVAFRKAWGLDPRG